MDATRMVVSLGLDRLFHETVAAALAAWGWHMLDVEEGHSFPIDSAEIVLVAASGTADAVIERVRCARAQFPSGRVVLLGTEASDTDLVRFIEAGVAAHVGSGESLVELIDVLEMVRNNCTPSSGRITQLVLGTIRQRSREPLAAEPQLTLREQEVLRLIRGGLSNKEIAVQLRIAPNTVKNHVHHLLEKLKVRSRHEAAWLEARPAHGLSRTARTGTDV
jgi:two-component system, NarL family, nitrate/nitrite response regulator NarL